MSFHSETDDADGYSLCWQQLQTTTSEVAPEGVDLATIILQRKNSTNTFLVDDSAGDDSSMVTIDPAKMKELDLFSGDTVLLKGKKRKATVAVVHSDEAVAAARVQMTKVTRSNLR